LSTRRVADLDESEKNACVDLLIKNMKVLYEKSNWGWSEKNKRAEMMEEAAWYLLAKNEEGKICGFSHFRYDMDFDDEVLYVYEVRTYHYKSDPKFSLNSKLIEKNQKNSTSFSLFY
jgi:hypothetical protein